MTPWKNFYPDVLTHAPGCPQPVMDQALLRAARDFCRQTRAWRATLDPIDLVAGESEYDLPLPNDGDVLRLEDWADISGDRVQLLSSQHTSFQCGRAVFTVTGRTVTVYPTPAGDAPQVLTLNVSMVPSNSAAGVPDDIYGDYVETIALKAASMLQNQPAKPYTNPGAAGTNAAMYQAEVDSLKVRLWRGRTNSRPRVIPFPF